MEVQVLSKKMVKPEVPTPHHLKTFKLSWFDQLAPLEHIPNIYFYHNISSNKFEIRDLLVKSLSKALTQFYPLAGRFVLDGFYVDCNDEGVLYIDAEVNLQLDDFLDKARKNMHLLNDLVPRSSIGETRLFTTPITVLQVSFFKCGGLAISVFHSHILADAFTITHFMKEWATTTRGLISGQLVTSSSCSFGFASLFPSRDLSKHVKQVIIPTSNIEESKTIAKRFLFDEKTMDALIANVYKFENLKRPKRVEVVLSVIWKALIRISKLPHSSLYPAFNLRGRTAINTPPLDNPSICGNYYVQFPIKFRAEDGKKVEELELHHVVKMFRNSLHNALSKYSKISSPDALFLEAANYINEVQDEMANEEVQVYHLTSLCNMPMYENDFGWGKPEWVTIPEIPWETVFLLDTNCGKGIEAIVNLKEVDMLRFEVDPTIVMSCANVAHKEDLCSGSISKL